MLNRAPLVLPFRCRRASSRAFRFPLLKHASIRALRPPLRNSASTRAYTNFHRTCKKSKERVIIYQIYVLYFLLILNIVNKFAMIKLFIYENRIAATRWTDHDDRAHQLKRLVRMLHTGDFSRRPELSLVISVIAAIALFNRFFSSPPTRYLKLYSFNF